MEYDFFLFEGGDYAIWRIRDGDGLDRASSPIAVQDIYAAKAIATQNLDGEEWFLLPVRDYYLMYYWIESTVSQFGEDTDRSLSGPDVWEYEDDMIVLY